MFLWASRRSAPDPEGPSRGDDMDTYDVGRDFQVVRMRRADGAALAVRRERLVSRSSLTLEPPLVVAPVGATAGGPVDDGDGGGSRFYRPPASGEAAARERGWGDGQAAVGRRSVWMNVSVHSSTELGSVGARLSAAPLFSSASAPVRHFSIWRITRSIYSAAPLTYL